MNNNLISLFVHIQLIRNKHDRYLYELKLCDY